MVRGTRIVWAPNALQSRKSIFAYWNKRNKSDVYSKKLNVLFNESIKQASLLHETGKPTEFKNIRLKIVSHFNSFMKFLIPKSQLSTSGTRDKIPKTFQ